LNAVNLLHRRVLFTDAQQLTISPRGTQIKTVHTGAMFTCSITDYQPPANWSSGPSIRWLGPGQVPVTATRGRYDPRDLHGGPKNKVGPWTHNQLTVILSNLDLFKENSLEDSLVNL